jgi:hypothetical protein
MNERILWLCVCISITIAAHYERARCITGYETQSQRLTKLSYHHWKLKQRLKVEEATSAELRHKGQELYSHCKKMGSECKKIIKGRLNCRPVKFLERKL